MQNNKPKPRDETHISLRVTKKQREKIDAAAKRCGILPSEYIRQRALGYAPKQMLPDAFLYAVSILTACCIRHIPRQSMLRHWRWSIK